MKIYTKKGDQGTTSLYGGKKLSKADLRIEAYGTIDELNSFVGLLMTEIGKSHYEYSLLSEVQQNLFVIGSILASDPDKDLPLPDMEEADVTKLEQAMDIMDEHLDPLKSFILPGGTISNSYAHVCRTITRRAERRVIALMDKEEVPQLIIKYLNRLSDYFFILARKLSKDAGVADIPWVPKKSK